MCEFGLASPGVEAHLVEQLFDGVGVNNLIGFWIYFETKPLSSSSLDYSKRILFLLLTFWRQECKLLSC
jgi:hypothetical protein